MVATTLFGCSPRDEARWDTPQASGSMLPSKSESTPLAPAEAVEPETPWKYSPQRRYFILSVLSMVVFALSSIIMLGVVSYTNYGAGPFAAHMTLMPIAFLGAGTLGVTSYRIFRDFLGYSHRTAKYIHTALMSIAAVIAFVGVAYLWRDHEINRDSQVEGHGVAHLQSLHSWVGIMVGSLWLAQTISALYLFFYAPPEVRKANLGLHKFFGAVIVVLTVATVLLGILSVDGRSDNSDAKHVTYKTAGILIVFMGVATAGVFATAPPKRTE